MTGLPTELLLLGWSVPLLLVHLFVQGWTMIRDRGSAWGAGPRDGDAAPLGTLAGRAARAAGNYRESYPAFVALALALVAAGRDGGVGALGATLWFAARVAYLPLYLAGVPWLRSIVWLVSLGGLILMLARLL